MESIIGFIVFAAVAAGMGYFVYTRIMKRKAEDALPRPANPNRKRHRDEPAPAPTPASDPVEPPKET